MTLDETNGTDFRVVPVGSCNVSRTLKSQWRNADHWHTLWPEGGHWCYPTEAEATARAEECIAIRESASERALWEDDARLVEAAYAAVHTDNLLNRTEAVARFIRREVEARVDKVHATYQVAESDWRDRGEIIADLVRDNQALEARLTVKRLCRNCGWDVTLEPDGMP